MSKNKLIYDLWYEDWNEEYEVDEFTDESFETARHWFCKKLGKFGDYEEEIVRCDRAVLFPDGKKMVEGENFALKNGAVIYVRTITDLEYIDICIVN